MSEYHHPLGPSKHPAWRQCPCYDGKDEAGPAAHRGTLQHKYLEELLKGQPPAEISPDDPDCLNEQEIESVLWAADFIKATSLGGTLKAETPVAYFKSAEDFEPIYEGTADAICH
jgi:hypothetical protein